MAIFERLKDGALIEVDERYLTDGIKKRLGPPREIEKPQAIKQRQKRLKDESTK